MTLVFECVTALRSLLFDEFAPLSCREKLAYECPRLSDPSHESGAGKIFNFAFSS
jgi:hypothetical protein